MSIMSRVDKDRDRGSYQEAEVLVSIKEASGTRDVVTLVSLCVTANALGDIQKAIDGANGADGSNRGRHGARTGLWLLFGLME